ncbi:MAG: class IV adenylate cyclase [Finegoldia sp.]|nr:class IV adenylate cyclase [Finegoldia sp.]
MEKELEVKVLSKNLDKIKKDIISKGAKILAHEYQDNILIDSSANPIKDLDYMRIRILEDSYQNISRKELTYKKRVADKLVRSYDEYTVIFDDLENMKAILQLLGFDIFEATKKERESFAYKNARFDFDSWDKEFFPFPYLEIEVKNEDDLDSIIEDLKLDRNEISRKSIKELKEIFSK